MSEVRANLGNLGFGDASKVLSDYQQWVSASAETLGFAFDHEAIETLVLTRRSWLLMEMHRVFGEADNGPAIHKTFGAERTADSGCSTKRSPSISQSKRAGVGRVGDDPCWLIQAK